VIVIDNNSSDGSAEMVKNRFPNARLIESKENLGYAKGVNLGLKQSQGAYVAIFHPDIFITKGALETLVNYLDANLDVAMVGPKLINADGSLQYSCYRFPKIYTPLLRRTFLGETSSGKKEIDRYLMKDFGHNESREVDWLLGGALLARKAALKEIGYLNEEFFLYFEDTDLGRKFKKAGYKVTYLPSAKMIHLHRRESADNSILSGLFNKTTRVHILSAIRYFRKYGPV
ncbi:MAG: glycosyltransferase family 2 protein, partial [Patescibacteria group bacterium]